MASGDWRLATRGPKATSGNRFAATRPAQRGLRYDNPAPASGGSLLVSNRHAHGLYETRRPARPALSEADSSTYRLRPDQWPASD